MGAKFLLIAVFALVAIQGFESTQLKFDESININHNLKTRDLVEDFLKLIGEIRQNIITVISKGAAKIDELLNDVIKMGKIKIQEAIAEMKKIEEAIKEEIKKLAEKAAEAGQNVEKCVLSSEMQISSLMVKVVDDMEKCFEGPEKIAQSMHEEIKAVMDKNAEIIDDLVEEFRKCEGFECRVTIITRGTEAMHEAYNKVQKIVESAIIDMSNALPNVLKCIRDERDYFEEEIFVVVEEFKSCIDMGSTFRVEERGMLDNLQKMMKEIFESIYNTIKTGMEHIDVVLEEIIQAAEKIFRDSMVEISKIVDEIQREIEAVMNEAKGLGDGVRKCVEAQRERVQELITNTQANVEVCLGSAKDIMEEMRAKAEKLINNTIEELNQLVEEFNNCNNMSCRVETVKKAYSAVREAQNQITKIVEETIAQIKDVIPEAEQCVRAEQENFQKEARNILADIRKCIADNNGGSLVESLEKIIMEAQENVRQLIAGTLATLQQQMQEFYDIVFNVAKDTKEEISEMAKEINNELTKLKENTKEMGAHVKFCINEREDKVDELVKQTQKSIEQCLEGLLNIFNELYEDVEKVMNEGYEKIFDLVGRFYDCTDLSCRTQVLKEGIQAVFEFNERVTDILARATNSMKEAIPETIKCIADQNKEFKVEARKIMMDINECIDM